MYNDESLLDNPIWSALTGHQATYAIGGTTVKRFTANIVDFASFADIGSVDAHALVALMAPGEALFTPAFPVPDNIGLKVISTFVVEQYVYRATAAPPRRADFETVILTPADAQDMAVLTQATDEYLFPVQRLLLGTHLGIRVGGRLVSMVGTRLHFGRFREISAVATHPDCTGQGFATYLITRLIEDILKRSEIPWLGFFDTNTRARSVYEKMGFEHRNTVPAIDVERTPVPPPDL